MPRARSYKNPMSAVWNRTASRSAVTHRWPVGTATCLFIALMLLVGWVTVERQIDFEQAEAERTAIAQTENRAIALEQYVARTLKAADLVTLHLGYKYFTAGDLRFGAKPGARPFRIADPVVDPALFAGAHAFNPQGDLIASTYPVDGARNVASAPTFIAQRANRSSTLRISPPLPTTLMPGTFVHASRWITDDRGKAVALIDLQLRPAQLLNFPEQAPFKPTDLVSVITLDGITLARREGNRVSFGQNVAGRLVMRMQMQHPNGTYLGPSSLDGHVRFFTHRRLQDYPVFVTAGVSRNATLAPVWERAFLYRGAMAALTLASLAVGLLTLVALNARKRRERDLANANFRLAEAQRVARIGSWDFDLRSGTVLWSGQLCTMYERSPGDNRLTLDDFRSYLEPRDMETVERAVASALATGEPQSYEIRVNLPSGATAHRHVIAVPKRNRDGVVTHLHGTDQDISQDKLVELLQAQLAYVGRQDAMSIMASTLAHEINQPLSAASNYLAASERLLARSAPDSSELLVSGMRAAREQIHSAANIIKRARAMVRKQEGARQATSLSAVIEETIAFLDIAGVVPAAAIEKRLSAADDVVWADPLQTQQVLVNLLRNAFEAAAEQPKVTIRTEADGTGFVKVEVEDNGGGFAQAGEDLFSPLESGKDGGLGLGLSISRTIVEYHRGRIWVEKSDATGTVIAFKLPRRALDEADDG